MQPAQWEYSSTSSLEPLLTAQYSYLSSLQLTITQALNSLLAAYKSVEHRKTRLSQTAREILSTIWLDSFQISELSAKQLHWLGIALPVRTIPQMETLRIPKDLIQQPERLTVADQNNLLCPSDCDPRYCSSNQGNVTQCYKPRSSKQLNFQELNSDTDTGVECQPFTNTPFTCPTGFLRCSEGHPYTDHYVVVHEADEPEPVVLRGFNLSPCSRLVLLPPQNDCSAKSPSDYVGLITQSQKAVGGNAGWVMAPNITKGANFEMLAAYAPRAPEGIYTMCYLEYQPGTSIQTQKDKGTAEFEIRVLKAERVGVSDMSPEAKAEAKAEDNFVANSTTDFF